MKTFANEITSLAKYLSIVTFIIIITLGCCGVAFIGLSFWTQTRQIELIVPDNYTGFLIVSYECPNGYTLQRQFRTVTIRFTEEGGACVTNTYEGGPFQIRRIITYSGESVPFSVTVQPTNAYIVTDAGVRARTSNRPPGPQRWYEAYWIGTGKDYMTLQEGNLNQTNYDETFKRNFGPIW